LKSHRDQRAELAGEIFDILDAQKKGSKISYLGSKSWFCGSRTIVSASCAGP